MALSESNQDYRDSRNYQTIVHTVSVSDDGLTSDYYRVYQWRIFGGGVFYMSGQPHPRLKKKKKYFFD